MTSYLGSVTNVGPVRGFFWALWTPALLGRGACVECGFADELAEAIAAMRALPYVRRNPLHLLPGKLARVLYEAVWLEAHQQERETSSLAMPVQDVLTSRNVAK